MIECPSCRAAQRAKPTRCENCGYQFRSSNIPGVVPGNPIRRLTKVIFGATAAIIGLAVIFAILGGSDPSDEPVEQPTRRGSTSTEETTSGEKPSSSSPFSPAQGLAANWLLSEQAERHRQTMEALTKAKATEDYAGFVRILRVRSRELAAAIDKVNTGSYSISDKQKVLNVLEQERNWAEASIEGLSQ